MSRSIHLTSPSFQEEMLDLVGNLQRFGSLQSLQQSSWFQNNKERLNQVLQAPHIETGDVAVIPPPHMIRCVSWNIEKGKKFDALLSIFQSDVRLAKADLIFLQEVDAGMARSGNRLIACELARALQMNIAFAPCFIELTRGVGDDLLVPGENRHSIQGNALLSRYPIASARITQLPQCFEPFDFSEKRYGNRNALVCEVAVGDRLLTAVCTHLEVRNAPRGRAKQMSALLESLAPLPAQPVVIAGDFNSNTFARGTAWRTLRGYVRLVTSTPEEMLESTLFPETREPLFHLLRRQGFDWTSFNNRLPTTMTYLRALEDVRYIPRFLEKRALRALRSFEKGLPLRLDWFAGRNLSCSESPTTIERFTQDIRPEHISDHRPILVGLQCDP